jgi:hypothetical protein
MAFTDNNQLTDRDLLNSVEGVFTSMGITISVLFLCSNTDRTVEGKTIRGRATANNIKSVYSKRFGFLTVVFW